MAERLVGKGAEKDGPAPRAGPGPRRSGCIMKLGARAELYTEGCDSPRDPGMWLMELCMSSMNSGAGSDLGRRLYISEGPGPLDSPEASTPSDSVRLTPPGKPPGKGSSRSMPSVPTALSG